MYKDLFLLVSVFTVIKATDYDVAGVLSCGQSTGLTGYGGDRKYYILDVSISDTFIINACGTYYQGNSDAKMNLYTYSGSATDTVIDSDDMEYYTVNDDYYYWTDTDCYRLDSRIEIASEAEDYYVLDFYEWSYDYSESYIVNLECGDVLTLAGTLQCGDELEEIALNGEHSYYLDVSSANSGFSVDTCGSQDEYGVDTELVLYGYEVDYDSSLDYVLKGDMSAVTVGVNDDDYYAYCTDEDEFTDDSYLVIDDLEYDDYILMVSGSGFSHTGQLYYDLNIVCDGSDSDSLLSGGSSGFIAAAVIIPIFVIIAAFFMYKKKQNQPQQQQGMMYQGGAMYGNQMSAPPMI